MQDPVQWMVQELILLYKIVGLQVDPEFNDANGVSRVQQIDWFLSLQV